MENASKALIIAGSIIIAVLLIGIGIYIFNSTLPIRDETVSQMNQMEKNMFNNKFTGYEGEQSGSNVKSLISLVRINNSEYEGVSSARVVAITPDNETQIVAGSKYIVTIEYNNYALVSKITCVLK